jgi:PmbA protein
VRRLNGRKLDTRTCPVLFEAPIATGLIGNFVAAVSGGSLYRKSSFLLDSLGQQVFSPLVNIHEAPFLPSGLGSAPFDSEGVACLDRDVVKDGVLQGYFLSTYSAKKLGMATTGNAGGSHNLLVTPGEHDLDGLIRQMGTGLLVTELLGHGANMVTGDYSRGAAGFWVENGEIQYPVEEVTIAGNLAEMFKGIVAIGRDIERRGSKQVGSILIDHMTVAGN